MTDLILLRLRRNPLLSPMFTLDSDAKTLIFAGVAFLAACAFCPGP